jgi:hypothetical protein
LGTVGLPHHGFAVSAQVLGQGPRDARGAHEWPGNLAAVYFLERWAGNVMVAFFFVLFIVSRLFGIDIASLIGKIAGFSLDSEHSKQFQCLGPHFDE